MARKSPLQLQRIALDLHRQGHDAARIADLLGLHPGSVRDMVRQAHPQTAQPSAPRFHRVA